MLSHILNIFKKMAFVHLIFLLVMTCFRIVFFLYYQELDSFSDYLGDIFNAHFLGLRIDLTVVGYIQTLPTLLLIIFYYLKRKKFLKRFENFLSYYIFICYFVASVLMLSDFAFYSYFKDHLNILFFGLFEDDTSALLRTFYQNYNVGWLGLVFIIYSIILFFLIKKIFGIEEDLLKSFVGIKNSVLIFVILIFFNFLILRGSVGHFPLGKNLPDISTNTYLNKIPQNGVRAFVDALKARKEALAYDFDYINVTGFKDQIETAFMIHKNSQKINRENLLENISYQSQKSDEEIYNIVVIMAEGFGMPILKYQSNEFDILGALKKHFDDDIVFTNIISEGNGTIFSIESLLLNIPYRSGSFAFSQSKYAVTSFNFAPPVFYNNDGYDTTFVYGGDLSWRALGQFAKRQGYKNVHGKQDIFHSLSDNQKKKDVFHLWGIYDEYLYQYIFEQLKHKKNETPETPQLIVALSTNNHPPYITPIEYNKNLIYSEELRHHLIGDFKLAQKRFKDYAYSLDSIGYFLDIFKKSEFKDNTIVVVTADNNTVEGIMKYDENPTGTAKNIPIYFYLPPQLRKLVQENFKVDTTVAGSHKDIFPTLYNLTLKKNSKYISIGTNLFDSTLPHYGFNGERIVNHGKEAIRINNLSYKDEDNDKIANYYKATIAVTEYLIKNHQKIEIATDIKSDVKSDDDTKKVE